MARLYYTAPSDEAFEEMKRVCLTQWQTHDNTYGYVTEKADCIKDIKNVGDNFMYMLAMFDEGGQYAVCSQLSEPTRAAVRERMVDGGNDDFTIRRIGL